MSAPRPAPASVLVIGGRGEFGTFLRRVVLPGLGLAAVESVDRETPPAVQQRCLRGARHVVLATPLAGYAERACELVYACRTLTGRRTLWLIPSVQAGVWRAVTATLDLVENPGLAAVFAHPMYGPNGFRAHEPEARTFQNVLTATTEGARHPLGAEVSRAGAAFWHAFHIATTTIDPETHDRVTACSQGLSYCVGRLMFEDAGLDDDVRARAPALHHAFHANHGLILDFVRLNAYMPLVTAAFAEAWRATGQATFADLLAAFASADAALNRGAVSPIPTKWYERLRALAAG